MSSDRDTSNNWPSPRFSRRWHWASTQKISFLMQQGVENPDVISLAAGLVDQDSLPIQTTRTAVEYLLSDEQRARTALQYGTTPGAESLRQPLLEHLARLEDRTVEQLGIDTDRLVLTTGSQQLLSLVGEILLDPDDICLVAAPTYFVYLGTLNGLGARMISVATDDDGMCPQALEAEFERLETAGKLDRVKLVYLVSYYENPSGTSLSAERRAQMVEIVRRWSNKQRIYILEDAAYRELHYDGPALPSLWGIDEAHEAVILAQTFSKSYSPGLRVGYGVLPRELVSPICDRKGNEDFGSANFNQQLLGAVLNQGLYEPHVETVRSSYRCKRDAMLSAAERHFSNIPGVSWVRPHGGLYVWMTLPESIDTGFDSRLFGQAVGVHKVMYVPGELFYAGDVTPRPNHQMRLSYGVQTPDGIDEGMHRLADAVRAVM